MVTFTLSEELQYLKVLNLPVGRPLELQLNAAPSHLVFVAAPNKSGASSLQVESRDGLFSIPSAKLDELGPADEKILFTIWEADDDGGFISRVKGEIRRVPNDGSMPDPVSTITILTYQGDPLTHAGNLLTLPTS